MHETVFFLLKFSSPDRTNLEPFFGGFGAVNPIKTFRPPKNRMRFFAPLFQSR